MSDRKLTSVKLFFDASDPQNEGYAYRACYSDGHQESEAYDEISASITPSTATLRDHCETIAEGLGGVDGETNFCHHDGGVTTWNTLEKKEKKHGC